MIDQTGISFRPVCRFSAFIIVTLLGNLLINIVHGVISISVRTVNYFSLRVQQVSPGYQVISVIGIPDGSIALVGRHNRLSVVIDIRLDPVTVSVTGDPDLQIGGKFRFRKRKQHDSHYYDPYEPISSLFHVFFPPQSNFS